MATQGKKKLPMIVNGNTLDFVDAIVDILDCDPNFTATADTLDDNYLQQLESIINAYEQPCVAVSGDCRIMTSNISADNSFDLIVGEHINTLNLRLHASGSLGEEVLDVLDSSRLDAKMRFVKTTFPGTDRIVTLTIIPLKLKKVRAQVALVLVADHFWSARFRDYYVDVYGLTDSEYEVLELFLAGYSLSKTAKLRGRATTTIKKQFYTLLHKCEANSQTELILSAFKISNFLATSTSMLEEARHPNRREVKFFRPHGRVVQVVIAGDFDGEPVLLFSTFGLRKLNAAYEEGFKQRGLMLISLSRPGFGESSPPLEDQTYHECLAGDVSAILDQLGRERCQLIAVAHSLSTAVSLANRLPKRISRISGICSALPPSYRKSDTEKANLWSSLTLRISQNPTIQRQLLRTSLQALMLMGVRRSFELFLRDDPQVLDVLKKPENWEGVEDAFQSIFKQGMEAHLHDCMDGMSEWVPRVASCSVPIDLLEGENQDVWGRDELEQFSKEYPNTVRIVEFPGTSAGVIPVHQGLFLDHLQSVPSTPLY